MSRTTNIRAKYNLIPNKVDFINKLTQKEFEELFNHKKHWSITDVANNLNVPCDILTRFFKKPIKKNTTKNTASKDNDFIVGNYDTDDDDYVPEEKYTDCYDCPNKINTKKCAKKSRSEPKKTIKYVAAKKSCSEPKNIKYVAAKKSCSKSDCVSVEKTDLEPVYSFKRHSARKNCSEPTAKKYVKKRCFDELNSESETKNKKYKVDESTVEDSTIIVTSSFKMKIEYILN